MNFLNECVQISVKYVGRWFSVKTFVIRHFVVILMPSATPPLMFPDIT